MRSVESPEYCRFIHVKKGTYNENITIPNEKPNIALVGDGMGVTIISANKNSKQYRTPHTATLGKSMHNNNNINCVFNS